MLSSVAAGALAVGLFDVGGWLYLFCGILDLFDGRVARATGRVSRSGAFYDSVVDRYAEFAISTGLCIYYRESWMLYVVLAFIIGSFMVSYTRARAEGLGVVEDAKVGLMQRPERLVYLGVSLIVSPTVAALFERKEQPIFILATGMLMFLAFSANVTALRRFWVVFRHLSAEDPKPARRVTAPNERASTARVDASVSPTSP
jgi:CDP-diacylglycerol--glycerol-3-phosphate 3-phosphatidyltransferase